MLTSKVLFALSILGVSHLQVVTGDPEVYLDKTAPLEARVTDLFNRLTPDEEIRFLSGASGYGTQPIPRLHVPSMIMSDAGAGVRGIEKSTQGPATNFSCGVMMAATWDPPLIGDVANAIGVEAHNKGIGSQVLLGPAVNIQRSPLGGRDGEFFSEDPYLTSRLTVDYVLGLQRSGTAACVKHFVCNNEEADRNLVDVRVSERALREIYFPAFKAAVQEGHTWTMMSSYNRVNGRHSSASRYLLTDVLKTGWGFDGAVTSDWGGVHQVAASLNAGNDIQMPAGGPITLQSVRDALAHGQIDQATIDDAVKRILRTIIRTGLLDGPWKTDPSLVNSQAHRNLARKVAEDGMVLLKNQDSILPLDLKKIHSIALIGPAAKDMQIGALGSPYVTPQYAIGPLAGIIKRVGSGVIVRCVTAGHALIPESAFVPADRSGGHGLLGEYFANQNLQGAPLHTRIDPTISFDWTGKPDQDLPSIGPDHFSVRWTGKLIPPYTGHYKFSFSADDGCRLYLNGKLLIDHWVDSGGEPESGETDLIKDKPCDLVAEYYQDGAAATARLEWELPAAYAYKDALDLARRSDVVILCVSTDHTDGEEHDRSNMVLPADQDSLIETMAAVNPHTIVVLNNGAPIDMRAWIDKVPGVLEAWFPGEEGGTALAEILFGDVNPSGKLPTTFGLRREDYPDYQNFPGFHNRVDYAEGIYVGYRHFDKDHINPLFPFGFGLSYTTFRYGPLDVSASTLTPAGHVTIREPVTNTGTRAGQEVVELYMHALAPRIDRPVRELKDFSKISLAPGETKTVSLDLGPRDLAYFDTKGKQWKADAGAYQIEVGSSSRDLRQKAVVHLKETYTQPVPLSRDRLAENGGFNKTRTGDLAMNRPVQASSESQGGPAVNAVDNNDLTAWRSSVGDPQWIMVDLGAGKTIDHARLFWGDAYPLAYSLQTSSDGRQWHDVYHTTADDGDVDWVTFPPTSARWIRVLATKAATPAGYTLSSFEVYGPGGEPASTPRSTHP